MSLILIDYMEYSSDALAQSAYVSDGIGSEAVNQQQTESDSGGFSLGDYENNEYRVAQGFQLSISNLLITAIEVGRYTGTSGTPTGDWTLRIETDSSGVPSGSLANSNASVTVTPPAESGTVKGTFSTPFILSASTQYWIVINCDNQSTSNNWKVSAKLNGSYSGGCIASSTNGTWLAYSSHDMYFKVYGKTVALDVYSEATIKKEGSYSLKILAAQTDSLNKKVTKTLGAAIKFSNKKKIKFQIRASRTGSNIKIGWHDSGGNTIEVTPNILSANTWQDVIVDISSVSDANKDDIDSIIITMVNSDADNVVYIDNMYVLNQKRQIILV